MLTTNKTKEDPMEGAIAPKPTTYRDIKFRSRLEARWAVCLDWYSFVNHWLYEPKSHTYDMSKFGGWSWTPDFYFATGFICGLLEVKPVYPTEEYLSYLASASESFDLPVFLAFADFYEGVPRLMKVDPKHPHKDTSVPLDCSPYFPRMNQAIQIAANYRFDLPNQPVPPFRQPVVGEYDFHLARWASSERRRNLQKKKK